MPTYEYRCKNGHQFEVIQSMADDPIAVCEVCGAPVERVFHPVAVHFKGSGFYTTDYGKNRSAASGSDSDSKKDSKESKDSKEPAKSESSTTSSSDSKSDAGSSSD